MEAPTISIEEVEFYEENGYLAVEQVLTSDEVHELRRVTDKFVK